MTEELGRELTATESIAVAMGQTTILDIVHEHALQLNQEWNEQVYTVMPSGTVITRGELWAEMRRTRLASHALRPIPAHSWIPGVNASTNMFG